MVAHPSWQAPTEGRYDMTAPSDSAARERDASGSCVSPEGRLVTMVARGHWLAHVLDGLCRLVEAQAPGVLASILLLEGDRLWLGGAPSLPKAYVDGIDGAVIGPRAGSCGTAAYRAQQVIVADIATDPLWTDCRGLALSHS